MKNLLISTLETLGYPVHLQGTMNPDEAYPPSFITVFTQFSEDAANFDNETFAVSWQHQVIFYSSDPVLVESVPTTIRNTLKKAGFIPQGRGHDIPSDEPSHTGWVQEYLFLETRKER